MKFSEEYKKAAKELNPSQKQINRMTANVISEIKSPKKPFAMQKIAYIGGTVAACAVITVTAVTVLPHLKSKSSLTDNSAPAIENMLDKSGDSAAEEFLSVQVTTAAIDYPAVETEADKITEHDAAFDETEKENPEDISENEITDKSMEETPQAPSEPEEPADYMASDAPAAADSGGEAGDELEEVFIGETAEGTMEPDFAEEVILEEPAAAEEPAETCEADFTDEWETAEWDSATEEADNEVEYDPTEDWDAEYTPTEPYSIMQVGDEMYIMYRWFRDSASWYYKRTEPVDSDFTCVVWNSCELTDIKTKVVYTLDFISEDGTQILIYSDGVLLGKYIRK